MLIIYIPCVKYILGSCLAGLFYEINLDLVTIKILGAYNVIAHYL